MPIDAVNVIFASAVSLGRVGLVSGPRSATFGPMATAKGGPSKPRKTTGTRRQRAFTVRMTDEQAAVVEQAAEQRALDVASWIRMVAFEAAKAQLAK